ncbi:MAG: metallophosphoesterase family protein [Pseudomonadota bacterium]
MSRRTSQLSDIMYGAWRAVMDRVYAVYDKVSGAIAAIELETRADGPSAAQEKAAQERRSSVPEGMRVYAVGDIHGRADLLKRLMETIRADAALRAEGERAILVFLGDYVDRGFQSKDVIDYLLSDSLADFEVVFLKGNHEAAFLEFLSDPAFGPEWARFGGAETLTSYGIRPPRTRTQMEEWTAACEALNEKLPAEHRNFLAQLDQHVVIGDYVFVHAGLRPGRALEDQVDDDVLWIRDTFLNDNGTFDQVVVHGHTPISAPYRDHRRIGVDTGAYLSGKLTAVRLMGEDINFVST